MFTRSELESASELVRSQVGTSPQLVWPLLNTRTGANVVVKHENHLPTGAFKVRGGATYIDWLIRDDPDCRGIITATRGNHGQSQSRAARAKGLRPVIYVPHGNSIEKNAAMRGWGAELHTHGTDFDESKAEAFRVAKEEGLHIVPPFHKELVRGVATYGFELFSAHPDLDAVYVPIGCGSGICATIAARDILAPDTQVIGVVPNGAACAKLSFEAGKPVETNSADTFADGTAVRVPVAEALDIYGRGAERIVSVSEDQIADAIRHFYTDTHNLAEGAGAMGLAALLVEKDRMKGKKVGLILSGGNIDAEKFATILAGGTPTP